MNLLPDVQFIKNLGTTKVFKSPKSLDTTRVYKSRSPYLYQFLFDRIQGQSLIQELTLLLPDTKKSE